MTDSPFALPELQARTDQDLRQVLGDVLALNTARLAAITSESGLFGHLPELDSMAVGTLLIAIEDRFGIVIEDEDIDDGMLETYGALLNVVVTRRSHD